jgi:hypothetical protein
VDGKRVQVYWHAGQKGRVPESLSRELREEHAQGGKNLRTGFEIRLKLGPEADLEKVARELAGERDPGSVLRYLKVLRSRSAEGRIDVPLESVLHPLIRDRAGKFAEEFGPNCFACGAGVNSRRPYSAGYLGGMELKGRVAAEYQSLTAGADLRAGDLLLYSGLGEPVHAATYIGEVQGRKIVFTKNGIAATSPYIFADKAWVDKIYEQQGATEVFAFRPPSRVGAPAVAGTPRPYELLPGCSYRFSDLSPD